MKRVYFLLLLFACIASPIKAQVGAPAHRGVVQVPLGNEVYPFLRHLSVRGLIKQYSEVQLPISEYEASEYLRTVDTLLLSSAERALRIKLLRTLAHNPLEAVTVFPARDAKPLFFEGIFTDYDKYLYRWRDDSNLSELYVNGIASLELRTRSETDPGKVMLGVIGGRMYGTLSGHVGYFLEATNGQSFGDSSIALEDPFIGKNKNFALYSKKDFDFTTAELSYNYDWFTAKLAREAVGIGGSYQGDNVILSPNVPYFDFVSLGAHVKSVRYQAMVASLLGDGRASLPIYRGPNDTVGPGGNIDAKYLTLHDLTFFIGNDFEMGFTDMVIFSRRFDLAYLNPFSFLKSVEHSLADRDNGLLALHTKAQIVDGVELRGQVLLDDVYASGIGDGWWGNKFAWQLGGMWSAPFGLNDVDIAVEWTRVEPFTYSHFNEQNTFSTSRTMLGYQNGPNTITWWSQVRWVPSEKWTFEVGAQLLQKGENIFDSNDSLVFNAGADFEQTIRDENEKWRTTRILDGRRVNVFSVTANASFEAWRGLTLFARGTKKSVNYLEESPSDVWSSSHPRQRPEVLIAIGARALF